MRSADLELSELSTKYQVSTDEVRHYQQNGHILQDLEAWFPGRRVREVAASPLNPLVFSRTERR